MSQFVAPKKIVNSVFYPKWSKNHMINIENKTKNPLTEHKDDILDRLNPNIIIDLLPYMRNMQVLQHFNTIEKMIELIKELKGMK